MNHRAKAVRYDDERWTMMSWMKHNKLAKTIAASIAAVGICFGATAVAFVQMVDLNRHNVLFLIVFQKKKAAG